MPERLNMSWLDLTVASKGKFSLPIGMDVHFDIQCFSDLEILVEQLDRDPPDAVCFDFDYPDQESLQLMLDLKDTHRSVPMLMVTLQHSEKLAVWAFRSKLVDYLVKPVPQVDIDRCHSMLLEIGRAKSDQKARSVARTDSGVPADITAGTRTIDKAFLPAIYHVAQNFDKKIQNDEVANLCAMSPFRFSRGFREVFGISFREYLIRYRLRQACHLLKNPNATVTDVAFAVGFNDVSYFSKMFKRHFRVSPTEKFYGDGQDVSPTAELKIPRTLMRDYVA